MAGPTPRISVIIPAYNRAALIGETIECMLRQTLSPHELIVVDDGSSDDTAAVVRSFGDRVELIRQVNAGAGAARNTGLQRASGEFVQFFDSDDLATFDKLEVQASALVRSGADVAYSPWGQGWFDGAHLSMGRYLYQQGPTPLAPLSAYLRNWILFLPACLVRRDLVVRVGGYPTAPRVGEDLELVCRMILAGARFVHAPGPVLIVRQHPENQISAAPELALARARDGVRLVNVVEALLSEAQVRPGLIDRLSWRSRAWQAERELARLEDRPAPAGPLEALVMRLGQTAAGLRTRLGGSRLGNLFAPGPITAGQRLAVRALGYQISDTTPSARPLLEPE